MPDLITTFNFALEIDNVNLGYFKKCSGIESETEIIEYKEATKDGQDDHPQGARGDEVGRHHARPPDRRPPRTLWEWRKQVDRRRRRHGPPQRLDRRIRLAGQARSLAGTSRAAGRRSGRARTSTRAPTRWPPRSVTITHEGLVRA